MTVWTEPMDVRLRELWENGASGAVIANLLNGEFRGAGFSRNAVIGRVHRKGLSGRRRPAAVARPRRYNGNGGGIIRAIKSKILHETSRPPKAVKPEAENFGVEEDGVTDLPMEQSAFAVTLLDVGHDDCRWPMTEPAPAADFRFCGAPKSPGHASYCPRHAHTSSRGIVDPRVQAARNARAAHMRAAKQRKRNELYQTT